LVNRRAIEATEMDRRTLTVTDTLDQALHMI
jgi:hypothetical protein